MDEMSLDNRHKFALPYWARPGIRLAKGAGKGGSSRTDPDDDDDEEDDDEEDEDEEDDEEEDGDDLDELTDEELRERLRDTQAQLSKASGSSAARRKQLRKVKAELEEARKAKPTPAPTKRRTGAERNDPEPVDVEQVKAATRAEAKQEADDRIKRSEARGALRAAGVPAERVAKAVGLIDLADLDVDDDSVDGLDDAIDALKKEWPELFPAAKRVRRQPVAGGGDRNGDGRSSKSTKKLSATDLQVAAALGKPIRR